MHTLNHLEQEKYNVMYCPKLCVRIALYFYCWINWNIYLQSMKNIINHTHGLLAEHLMHMAHKIGNTSGVSKSSSDWLKYTGFPEDKCVGFFNVLSGSKMM